MYTDQPCPLAREQRPVDLVDNVFDSAEARRAMANDAVKNSNAATGAARPAPARSLTQGASARDPGSLASSCTARKRDYEIAVSMINKDPALMKRRHAAAAQACGAGLALDSEHERLLDEIAQRKKRGARGSDHELLPTIVTK